MIARHQLLDARLGQHGGEKLRRYGPVKQAVAVKWCSFDRALVWQLFSPKEFLYSDEAEIGRTP
jgi:hypothetical protein